MWIRSFLLLLVLAGSAVGQRVKLTRRPYQRAAEVKVMAAKTTIWTGAVDDDWDEATVGNWSNGKPAYIAAPGPYDTVYVSPTATNAMGTNLDRTGDGAGAGLHLALFETHTSVTDDIGSSGSELKLTASKIVHRGRGTFYFVGKSGTDGSDISRFIIDSQGGAVLGNAAGTLMGQIEFLAGDIDFTITADVGSISLGYGNLWAVPLDLTIDGAGNTSILQMAAGKMTYNATGSVSDMVMSGGEVTCNMTGNYLYDLWMTGGTFYLDGAGSQIDRLFLMGGMVDTTRTTGSKAIVFLRRWLNTSFIANSDFVVPEIDYVLGEN